VVDLAEVNGRVFVNNVSLGLYAEAVQHAGYRDAKLRTLLDIVPDVMGTDGEKLDLPWTGPEGDRHDSAATILVSNNRYRLGGAYGSGTRPRLDEALLGVAVVEARTGGGAAGHRPWREWTSPDFEIPSSQTVPAGVDGEAVELSTPVRFRTRPAALHVRISASHPGASPSASAPQGLWAGVRTLAGIAAG
jgi:diacylglycerol kinase family enzyme